MREGPDIWKEGGKGYLVTWCGWDYHSCGRFFFHKGSTVGMFYTNDGNLILCFSVLWQG